MSNRQRPEHSFPLFWLASRGGVAAMSMGERNVEPAAKVLMYTWPAGCALRSPMLMVARGGSKPAPQRQMTVAPAGCCQFLKRIKRRHHITLSCLQWTTGSYRRRTASGQMTNVIT